MLELNVAQRKFHIWRLELWWIAFDKEEFYPKGRVNIKGNWFWRCSNFEWRYLFHPIKYLLRNKVRMYKAELDKIKWRQQNLKLKSRRLGMTMTTMAIVTNDIDLSIKYQRFIDKWDL